jgi:hypothetical protein
MSAYQPPLENLPIFDSSQFTNANNSNGALSNEYLQFPTAQGTENFTDINVGGILSVETLYNNANMFFTINGIDKLKIDSTGMLVNTISSFNGNPLALTNYASGSGPLTITGNGSKVRIMRNSTTTIADFDLSGCSLLTGQYNGDLNGSAKQVGVTDSNLDINYQLMMGISVGTNTATTIYTDANAYMYYNPFTSKLTCPKITSTFTGNLTGNVTGNVTGNLTGSASQITTTNTTTSASYFLTFSDSNVNGNGSLYKSASVSVNPNTNTITATTFSGNLSGNVTGNLTGVASQITTTNTTANATHYLNFSDSSSTGNGSVQKTAGLNVNPNTNTITATNLITTNLNSPSATDLTINSPTKILLQYNLTTIATINNLGVNISTGYLTSAGNITINSQAGDVKFQSNSITYGYVNSTGFYTSGVNFIGTLAGTSYNTNNINSSDIGAIPYTSATNTTLFSPVGTAGQNFISGGAGQPSWINNVANISGSVVAKTGNYTIATTDLNKIIPFIAPAGGCYVILPISGFNDLSSLIITNKSTTGALSVYRNTNTAVNLLQTFAINTTANNSTSMTFTWVNSLNTWISLGGVS